MKLDYKTIKAFFYNKKVYPTLLILVVDLLLIVGLIYFGLQLRTKYTDLITSEDDVQSMKATITLIRNNQSIFNGRIDEYNELLEELIPNNESYFSVITTLEQLAARTGVVINAYSVNLDSTTEEKLTLSVTIEGDATSLQRFIQEYKYGGGRLLTTDGLNITPDELESMVVSLNFYHNEFRDTVSSTSRVAASDLELLDTIRTQL